MSDITPVRVGLLMDYLEGDPGWDPLILEVFEFVADELREQGILERGVEFVVRAVQGLPKGSFRAVRDAFHELVEEDVLAIYGPWVSENCVALRQDVESVAQVPCISMGASEHIPGEWFFALPAGSMEEEPVIIAAVAAYDGCRSVGIAYEDSLIGQEYLRTARTACKEAGLRITAEVPIPDLEADKQAAMRLLAADQPDGIVHVGFGLGLVGMNAALEAVGWLPPRYTTTAFEFAASSDWWREQLAGWTGLDQYDERNEVGQAFLDRFEAKHGRRPAYYMPLYCYDVARLILLAVARARPLTGPGVKDALERIKMLPAATGAPGTRMRFGRYVRNGWVGSEYLVARRVLPDASGTVLHGTIQGLVEPPALGAS